MLEFFICRIFVNRNISVARKIKKIYLIENDEISFIFENSLRQFYQSCIAKLEEELLSYQDEYDLVLQVKIYFVVACLRGS